MLVYGYGNTDVKTFTEAPPQPATAANLQQRVTQQCTRIVESTDLDTPNAYGDGYILFDQGLELFAAWATESTYAAYSWDSTA